MKPWAVLIAQSPFVAVFTGGVVPIVSASPSQVHIDGCGIHLCYFTDLDRCAEDVLLRLARKLIEEVGEGTEPVAAVLAEITRDGLPLRESYVDAVYPDYESLTAALRCEAAQPGGGA